MSQFHIRNALHRLYSNNQNYLLLSDNIENILFQTLSTNMDVNFITTVPVNTNNKNIIFTSDHYLFPYAGIISDKINSNLMRISQTYNLPVYGIVSNKIVKEHINILNNFHKLHLITSLETEFEHPRIRKTNKFCTLNRSNKKPSKNIVVLSYAAQNTESLTAVIEALDKNKIPYDEIKENPLSLEYLYLTLENYKICVDVSEHSILEPILSTKTNTLYIHSNENLKEHIFVDNTSDLLKSLEIEWNMTNFDQLNSNIDKQLSSEYFNEIKTIITGRKIHA